MHGHGLLVGHYLLGRALHDKIAAYAVIAHALKAMPMRVALSFCVMPLPMICNTLDEVMNMLFSCSKGLRK